MRIGMIGLDTSHCVAFTKLLNDPTAEHHIPGGRVVAAYPGGSPHFSLSRDRVAGFTRQLATEFGVEIVADIGELVRRTDAILLESVDGRQHREQFEAVAVGIPVFVDKPLATSASDAQAIVETARASRTPLMSCSSLRYAAGIADLVAPDERVDAAEAFGPATLLDDYPGLFWYGVHAAEVLFSFMGRGCQTVRCIEHEAIDVVVGRWDDGRVGVLRGTRLSQGYFGAVVHTGSGTEIGIARSDPPYYKLMLDRVMRFFATGEAPIDIDETVEIMAFLESAERSRAESGQPADLRPR